MHIHTSNTRHIHRRWVFMINQENIENKWTGNGGKRPKVKKSTSGFISVWCVKLVFMHLWLIFCIKHGWTQTWTKHYWIYINKYLGSTWILSLKEKLINAWPNTSCGEPRIFAVISCIHCSLPSDPHSWIIKNQLQWRWRWRWGRKWRWWHIAWQYGHE